MHTNREIRWSTKRHLRKEKVFFFFIAPAREATEISDLCLILKRSTWWNYDVFIYSSLRYRFRYVERRREGKSCVWERRKTVANYEHEQHKFRDWENALIFSFPVQAYHYDANASCFAKIVSFSRAKNQPRTVYEVHMKRRKILDFAFRFFICCAQLMLLHVSMSVTKDKNPIIKIRFEFPSKKPT